MSFSLEPCIEAWTTTQCGVTETNGLIAAHAITQQFNMTIASITRSGIVDALDSFLVVTSTYDSSQGFTESGLSLVLNWLRGIPITLPEVIVSLEDSTFNKPATSMKAILGYWQFPTVTYSDQRILVNGFDFTTEVANLLQTLTETSWAAFGTALGRMLSRVPASSYTLTLPTDYRCPPSWWSCTGDEVSLANFVWYIIKSMGLESGVTIKMVQNAIDEDDIKYLYHFYNLAAFQNMNGGFTTTEATESFVSLYEAVQALTDADTSNSTETAAISKFHAAIQSIAKPRSVVIGSNIYVNGQNIWGEFGSVIFYLTQGYVNKAGIAIGKVLLILNTPRINVFGSYNDTIVPNAYANSYAQDFLLVLLQAYSKKDEGRMLAARKLDSCTGNTEDSLVDSAKTIAALYSGNWASALYQGTKAVCNYADIADTCQDKFDMPDDIIAMCDVLQNWPEFALDVAEYLFEFAEENFFPGLIKAANSIFQGASMQMKDFVADAADEIGDCAMDLLKAFLSGPMLSISAAAILVAAQL